MHGHGHDRAFLHLGRCNRPPQALPCYGLASVVEITTNTRKNYLRPLLLFLTPKNLQRPGLTLIFSQFESFSLWTFIFWKVQLLLEARPE